MIGRIISEIGSFIRWVKSAPIKISVIPIIAIFKVLGISIKMASINSMTPINKWNPSGYPQFSNISNTPTLLVSLPTLANKNPIESKIRNTQLITNLPFFIFQFL